MSKRGRAYTDDMIDLLMLRSPQVSKSHSRASLVKQLAPLGEAVASLSEVIDREEKLMRELKASEKLSKALFDKAVSALERALEVDSLSLQKASRAYDGTSRLEPYEPHPVMKVNGHAPS